MTNPVVSWQAVVDTVNPQSRWIPVEEYERLRQLLEEAANTIWPDIYDEAHVPKEWIEKVKAEFRVDGEPAPQEWVRLAGRKAAMANKLTQDPMEGHCAFELRCALAEIDRLRAALQAIADREGEARACVQRGDHNTTFAIDLASQARLALAG